MNNAVAVSVFSRVPDCPTSSPAFYWYREGNESEKKRGQHIVIEDILDEKSLEIRLRKR